MPFATGWIRTRDSWDRLITIVTIRKRPITQILGRMYTTCMRSTAGNDETLARAKR